MMIGNMKNTNKKYHKISNGHEAWWFIYSHPKFMLPERNEVSPGEAAKLEARGYWITRDKDGKCYRMYRHLHRHAIDLNLDIHYTKTNKPGGHGTVDKDPKKNKFVEVWLEFGQEEYMYATPWDEETNRMGYHDWRLDTGAPTFDQALVRLARLVRKHYGDYKPHDGPEGKCGKPVCGDCAANRATMEKLGLNKIKIKTRSNSTSPFTT
jgi:hypothetical protein